MALKVTAFDLDRVVQNVNLYSDPKAMRLQEVLFHPIGDKIHVYACDDYVALTDSLDIQEGTLKEDFTLTVQDLDKLGDWIKKDKKVVHKYDIEIRPKFTGMIFECNETSTEEISDNIFFTYAKVNEGGWEIVKELLDLENQPETGHSFSVRPERLAKLARVKADKEAPIAMRFVDVRGMMIIQFKKGETAYGAIMPVREEYVQEEFLW